jgi:hypothetical protein
MENPEGDEKLSKEPSADPTLSTTKGTHLSLVTVMLVTYAQINLDISVHGPAV